MITGAKANDTRFNIIRLFLSNKCWARLRLGEYSVNFCWATPYFENGGQRNVVIALCCESWCCAKKENGKIWTRDDYKKNKTSFGALIIHLRQNVDVLIDRNFLRMDFTFLRELPQFKTPVIIRQARRWTREAQSPPKERPAIMLRTQPNLQPAMLDLPKAMWHESEKKNVWLTSLNKWQLVERNKAKLYFGSTTFNSFQHVEWHISTFNITWYTVQQQWQHLLLNNCWTLYHWLKFVWDKLKCLGWSCDSLIRFSKIGLNTFLKTVLSIHASWSLSLISWQFLMSVFVLLYSGRREYCDSVYYKCN